MISNQKYRRKDFDRLSKNKAIIEVEVRVGSGLETRFGVVHHPEQKTVWVGPFVCHYKQIRNFKEL